jgi:hypothetical protein
MSKAAMKLALEFVEYHSKYWNGEGQHPQEIATALREALAEQPHEQEPVAIVSGYYGGQCVILPIDPARIFNSNTALYTSPPAQRKPLSDDEIWRQYRFLWPFHPEEERKLASDILMFARAIEAAHGIKENT